MHKRKLHKFCVKTWEISLEVRFTSLPRKARNFLNQLWNLRTFQQQKFFRRRKDQNFGNIVINKPLENSFQVLTTSLFMKPETCVLQPAFGFMFTIHAFMITWNYQRTRHLFCDIKLRFLTFRDEILRFKSEFIVSRFDELQHFLAEAMFTSNCDSFNVRRNISASTAWTAKNFSFCRQKHFSTS